MEIGTGLSILGAALGGKDTIQKILGPTAEYVGEQIKEWTASYFYKKNNSRKC